MGIYINKIAAGIVLFNPDNPYRLRQSIESVLSQVEKVYLFDNSTKKEEYPDNEKIIYYSENENKGIAYALNQIMAMAKADGYEWLITMDQDSILPDGIINDFEVHTKIDKIGIICPQVIDKRRAYMKVNTQPNEEYIEMCITSGSCTSIKVWETIGQYDDRLFIDLVDNEFCKRLIFCGYRILRLNKWVLDQEFGKIVPKSPFKQKFWIKVSKILHNENFAKFSYKKSVSPLRVYYTCRNIIYVNRKLKLCGPTAYENYNCKGYLGFVFSFIIPSFLRATQKRKVVKAFVKGTCKGICMKVEPWKI